MKDELYLLAKTFSTSKISLDFFLLTGDILLSNANLEKSNIY